MYIKNNPIDYHMISLQKRAEFGYISLETLKFDCWYCSGYGGILVFSDADFQSKFFDEILQLVDLKREDLEFDKKSGLYTIPLLSHDVFMKVIEPNKSRNPKYTKPFIRFEVITTNEFNNICPPINFVSSAMVTRYYVENNCKR